MPESHLVDTCYVEAKGLVASRETDGVDLIGPTRADYRWQARAGEGFEAGRFQIDWEQKQATCPEGHVSCSWTPTIDSHAYEVIKIKFARPDCQDCPSRAKCTQTASGRRGLAIRPREHYLALKTAREREGTEAFKEAYRQRAGIEGTLSEGGAQTRSATKSICGLAENTSATRIDRRGD